jgi:diguanylate cyclase (GGDEF)-like protein
MGLVSAKRSDTERKIASGLRTGWIALGTLLGLIALSAALVVAFEHALVVADDLARQDERQLVQRLLHRSMESGVTAQLGLINWNEAVDHVAAAPSHPADMAWIDHEFGTYAWQMYGLRHAFVVDGRGQVIRAWVDGRPALAATPDLKADIATLIARSYAPAGVLGEQHGWITLAGGQHWPVDRNTMPLPRWAGGLVLRDGRIGIITAASIVPDHAPAQTMAAPAWFVTIRTLGPAQLAGMQRDLVLPDLRLDSSGPGRDNAIALTALDGMPIGWLCWTARSPSPAILRSTGPMLWAWSLLFIGVLIGGTIVLRRSWWITRELLISEAQARHNAQHDAMSGLPNRVHAMQQLRQDLAMCLANAEMGDVFVGYVDLDGFKVINDTQGHHVGDELVREVAIRLRHLMPESDFIARLGGDEFVVLRRAVGGWAMADQFGGEIMAVFAQPFAISGVVMDVTCSCGISWGPAQSEDPGELLRRADIALYRAKQRGRARYRRYTRDMDASVKLRLELERELRRAVARDELAIAYQPIVTTQSGAIVGVEALLRWQHPERGAIRPDLFVPIAEQGGLMIALGNWMLRRVFAQCRDWPVCDISVNLSPIQIMSGGFLESLAQIVTETGIDPARVVLEITEGVMLDRSDHVLGVLGELGRMGFRIALDDFGKGYSSLSYLRLFNFERIKIDRSFVSNVESDSDAKAILCTIATLGHSLRMKVVAEGVETETQRQLVQAAGCELVQGFLFWKPMPGDAVRALLEADAPAINRLRA